MKEDVWLSKLSTSHPKTAGQGTDHRLHWRTIFTNMESVSHQKGVFTTFPQCNFSLEFPEILIQNLLYYHQLSVSWNYKILHCGILINMPYCKDFQAHSTCSKMVQLLYPIQLWQFRYFGIRISKLVPLHFSLAASNTLDDMSVAVNVLLG